MMLLYRHNTLFLLLTPMQLWDVHETFIAVHCSVFVSTSVPCRSFPGDTSAYICICHAEKKMSRAWNVDLALWQSCSPGLPSVFSVTFRNHETKKKNRNISGTPLWHSFVSCGRTFLFPAGILVHTTNPGKHSSLDMPGTWLRSVVQLHNIVLLFFFSFLSLTLKLFSLSLFVPSFHKKKVSRAFNDVAVCFSASTVSWRVMMILANYRAPLLLSFGQWTRLREWWWRWYWRWWWCWRCWNVLLSLILFFLERNVFGVECWKARDSSSMHLWPLHLGLWRWARCESVWPFDDMYFMPRRPLTEWERWRGIKKKHLSHTLHDMWVHSFCVLFLSIVFSFLVLHHLCKWWGWA